MINMKICISRHTVNKLVHMLVDFHKMDLGQDEDHQIWGDFDCVGIMNDFLEAERNRNEDDTIDVGKDTITWMMVVLENLLDSSSPTSV